jgi:hypothetical protein
MCPYYDQVAWLPSSRAIKSFQELHSHTVYAFSVFMFPSVPCPQLRKWNVKLIQIVCVCVCVCVRPSVVPSKPLNVIQFRFRVAEGDIYTKIFPLILNKHQHHYKDGACYEMCVAFMGERKIVYRILIGNREGKRSLRRPRSRWEGNIKVWVKEIGCEDVGKDRVYSRAFLSMVMKPAGGRISHWYSAGLLAGWSGGSRPGRGWEFFSSSPRPDRLCGPPSLMSNGYQGPSLSFHLVQRWKNSWRYTSTPQYAFIAWCSVKSQGQLYLYVSECQHFSEGSAPRIYLATLASNVRMSVNGELRNIRKEVVLYYFKLLS